MTAVSTPGPVAMGFADPVDDAQRTFRKILEAMSQPGLVVDIGGPAEQPDALSNSAAAVLLALADYTTPVFAAPGLDAAPVAAYLAFHTGAPMTTDPAGASFALIPAGSGPIDLLSFAQGTPDYPDRSTTLILEVESFDTTDGVSLSGPGIETVRPFAASPLPGNFWMEMKQNAERFPLGIDVILTAPGRIAAVPRSTRIGGYPCTLQ